MNISSRFPLFAFAAAALCGSSATVLATGIAGEYTAAFDGGTFAKSGSVRVVLDAEGRGSASVRLGSEPNCVVFMLPDFPSGSPLLISGGDDDMILHFSPTFPIGQPPQLIGTITLPAGELPLTLTPTSTTATAARHTFSTHTTGTTGTTGSGFAQLTATAHVSGFLWFAEHQRVPFAGKINAAGELPIAVNFGKTKGIIGTLTFANTGSTGTLTYHATGESQTVSTAGSTYDPALRMKKGAIAIAIDSPTVSFYDTTGSATVNSLGQIVAARIGQKPATFTLTQRTGIVLGQRGTGSFIGVVQQKEGTITGLYTGPRKTKSPFTIEPIASGGQSSGSVQTISIGSSFSSSATILIGSGSLNMIVSGVASQWSNIAPSDALLWITPLTPPSGIRGIPDVIPFNGGRGGDRPTPPDPTLIPNTPPPAPTDSTTTGGGSAQTNTVIITETLGAVGCNTYSGGTTASVGTLTVSGAVSFNLIPSNISSGTLTLNNPGGNNPSGIIVTSNLLGFSTATQIIPNAPQPPTLPPLPTGNIIPATNLLLLQLGTLPN